MVLRAVSSSLVIFLSTLSLRRATVGHLLHAGIGRISIHALLAESDRYKKHRLQCNFNFYPRSPCGERQNDCEQYCIHAQISIHALLAESDNNINSSVNTADQISIHALLAESDWSNRPVTMHTWKFLSTLSLRRATRSLRQLQSALCYFYPRSPCGERRALACSVGFAS